MKIIRENDTIQIELTSFCPRRCSNCTRFCTHYRKPWYMQWEQFKRAVDSLATYRSNQGVGIMGGEPLYHPEFERFVNYAAEKIGPENLGLWSCFPPEKARYGELIERSFGTVFPNSHERPDVIHSPFLVSIRECVPEKDMWYLIEKCWAWASWSASVNLHGAYFCEIAASLAALFDDAETAWPVEDGWWLRTPKDYREQIEKWCPLCGGANCGSMVSMGRYSNEELDDVSPQMLERLQRIDSPRIRRGEYRMHDLKPQPEFRKMAAYKDEAYRNDIVRPYGLFLMCNDRGFMAPVGKIIS